MNWKKIFCKLKGNHLKSYGYYKCKDGFTQKRCNSCNTIEKEKCPFVHCDCCGEHCTDPILYWTTFGSRTLKCQCNKCRLKRSLTQELWNSNKIMFLQFYQSYFKTYGKEMVDEVISGLDQEIKDDIEKYSVLL